jgi:hypothetical protein
MHLNSAPSVYFRFEVSATKLGKLGKPFYVPNYLTTHWLETISKRVPRVSKIGISSPQNLYGEKLVLVYGALRAASQKMMSKKLKMSNFFILMSLQYFWPELTFFTYSHKL